MNIRLVEQLRQLKEEDLFPNASKEEIKKRNEERPLFQCPLCKFKTEDLAAVPEQTPYSVLVSANGHVSLQDLDQSDDYDRSVETEWNFFCPRCGKDITKYLEVES